VKDSGWIPVASAVALLNGRYVSAAPKVLRNTLNCCVDVRSRGVPAIDGIEPVALGPEQWSTMVFNLERQSLNPPSKRRIVTGFTKVELLRSDVERLAAPVTEASGCSCQASGTNEHKLLAVNAEIKRLGVPALDLMSQDVREHKVVEAVKELHGGLKVSPRYVRERFAEAKKQSYPRRPDCETHLRVRQRLCGAADRRRLQRASARCLARWR
jgi:hypothetical protein